MKITLKKFSTYEFIQWPTLKVSEKKACLVQTPAGDVWLNSWHVNRLSQPKEKRDRDELINFLRGCTSSSADCLVPVSRAGKGTTEKSAKFTVQVSKGEYEPSNDTFVNVNVERTFTLPVSQVIEKDGQTYLPLWVFKKHLGHKESVVGTLPGFEKIIAQLDEGFARLESK